MKIGRDIKNRHLGNIFAIIVMLFLIFFVGISNGQDHSQPQDTTNNQQPEDWKEIILEDEYEAGKMIIEHIIDAHEWHILSIGEKHVSIPLPVILVYEENCTLLCRANSIMGMMRTKDLRLRQLKEVIRGRSSG